jgi:hypothetical protein
MNLPRQVLSALVIQLILICLSKEPTSAQTVSPKPLLIYYGFPAKINGLTTAQEAATEFSRYAYVVWPDQIEDYSKNPAEAPKAKTILDLINPATKVYGYVSLSQKIPTPLTEAQIFQRLDAISAFGFKGVLFDECGYVDGVSRSRMTNAVQYAHTKNLVVLANTLYSTCLFQNAYNPVYNPTQIPSALGSQDGYLFESHVIINGNYFRFAGENGSQYDEWDYWRAKSDTLRQFQKQIGFKVFSITTPDYFSTYTQAKHYFAWYCAWLWGHEATGWSEQNYSSDAPNNTSSNLAPFRTPPTITTPGNRFLTEFSRTGNEHVRFTNTGRIWANTETKMAGFTTCGTITSSQTGVWTNAGIWSGGRVPYPCDAVIIGQNHTVSIPEPVTARKVTLSQNGKIRFDTQGKLIVAGE